MGAGEVAKDEGGEDATGGLLSLEALFGAGVSLMARLLVLI